MEKLPMPFWHDDFILLEPTLKKDYREHGNHNNGFRVYWMDWKHYTYDTLIQYKTENAFFDYIRDHKQPAEITARQLQENKYPYNYAIKLYLRILYAEWLHKDTRAAINGSNWDTLPIL